MKTGVKTRTASTYLSQLKKAYAEWDANRLNDAAYNEIAQHLWDEVERRGQSGEISPAAYDRFMDEYDANLLVVNSI